MQTYENKTLYKVHPPEPRNTGFNMVAGRSLCFFTCWRQQALHERRRPRCTSSLLSGLGCIVEQVARWPQSKGKYLKRK